MRMRRCVMSASAEHLLQCGELFLARALRRVAAPTEAEARAAARGGASGLDALREGRVLGGALRGVAGARSALALLLAGLLAAVRAGDGAHARHLRYAALGDGLHHLGGLLEARDELVHVGDRHARALRDA